MVRLRELHILTYRCINYLHHVTYIPVIVIIIFVIIFKLMSCLLPEHIIPIPKVFVTIIKFEGLTDCFVTKKNCSKNLPLKFFPWAGGRVL